jgi:RES domain-containing protein
MDHVRELIVFRSTVEKYCRLLDGAGAAQMRRSRWNEFGQNITYAASSRALALLESRVHCPLGPPKDAVISVIRIALPIQQIGRIELADLPSGWRDPTDVGHCQIRGSRWYRECVNEKLLIVPSVLVPLESIYAIRGGIKEAEVLAIEPLHFDPRLWECERVDKDRVYTLASLPPG